MGLLFMFFAGINVVVADHIYVQWVFSLCFFCVGINVGVAEHIYVQWVFSLCFFVWESM